MASETFNVRSVNLTREQMLAVIKYLDIGVSRTAQSWYLADVLNQHCGLRGLLETENGFIYDPKIYKSIPVQTDNIEEKENTMSLEEKIEKLTDAVERNTMALQAAQGTAKQTAAAKQPTLPPATAARAEKDLDVETFDINGLAMTRSQMQKKAKELGLAAQKNAAPEYLATLLRQDPRMQAQDQQEEASAEEETGFLGDDFAPPAAVKEVTLDEAKTVAQAFIKKYGDNIAKKIYTKYGKPLKDLNAEERASIVDELNNYAKEHK